MSKQNKYYWSNTQYHVAARNGDEDVLKETTVDQLTMQNDYGYTPLHHAVIGGNSDIFRELAGQVTKEQLSLQTRWGDTPLHLAVTNHNQEIVAIILNKITHDQLIIPNEDGNIPLHLAVRADKKCNNIRHSAEIFRMISEKSEPSDWLIVNNKEEAPKDIV